MFIAAKIDHLESHKLSRHHLDELRAHPSVAVGRQDLEKRNVGRETTVRNGSLETDAVWTCVYLMDPFHC